MFTRKINKQSKIKRFILKLLNVYAYDKETLNIVNPDYKNVDGNIVSLNDKSFNFSRGYLELTRKITKLDIFFRYSPDNSMWNSTESWKRIVPGIDKKTLISVCLISLKNSILHFLENNHLDITINLIADKSNEIFDEKIINILSSDKIKVTKSNSKINGNRGSYLECCDQAEKSEDLIFFIEDDYLFEKNCIDEIIHTYSRVSSSIKNDIVICPSDYPFFYDSLYQTTLFVGKNYRWRKINETLLTFLFSKEIFDQYKEHIRKVGDTINEPFEKPLHEVYKKVNCLAPINSLSHHISRSVPTINEDWNKTWNYNFDIYKKFNP
jgi:hypothetical protein